MTSAASRPSWPMMQPPYPWLSSTLASVMPAHDHPQGSTAALLVFRSAGCKTSCAARCALTAPSQTGDDLSMEGARRLDGQVSYTDAAVAALETVATWCLLCNQSGRWQGGGRTHRRPGKAQQQGRWWCRVWTANPRRLALLLKPRRRGTNSCTSPLTQGAGPVALIGRWKLGHPFGEILRRLTGSARTVLHQYPRRVERPWRRGVGAVGEALPTASRR